jgi:hypothetical protein
MISLRKSKLGYALCGFNRSFKHGIELTNHPESDSFVISHGPQSKSPVSLGKNQNHLIV